MQPSEVTESVHILMDEMRQREGLPNLRFDKMLVGLAQYPLQYFVEGTWNREVGEQNLRKAGFAGGPAYQIGCSAKTVLGCLDKLSWEIEARQALLDPQIRNFGIATYVDTTQVAVLINLTSE